MDQMVYVATFGISKVCSSTLSCLYRFTTLHDFSSLCSSWKSCAKPPRTFYSPAASPKETLKHLSSARKAVDFTSTVQLHDRSGSHHMMVSAHTAKATAGFGSHKEVKDPRFGYKRCHCSIALRREANFWTRAVN
jgi:hypothetical protein